MLAMHGSGMQRGCCAHHHQQQAAAPVPVASGVQRHRRRHQAFHPAPSISGEQQQQAQPLVCSAHSATGEPPSFSGRGKSPARVVPQTSAPVGYNGPSTWSTAGPSAGPSSSRGSLSKATGSDSQGGLPGSSGEALMSPDLLGKTATVRFHLKYKTNFGQAVKLIGSHPKLGNWNLKDALELRWTSGDQWVANVQLPAGSVYEYKYVLVDYETKAALEWQSGSNAVLAVVVSETDVSVFDNWGNNPGAMVQVDEEKMTRETKLQKWATEMMGYWKEARRLQIELVHKNNESQGLRNELAQLRMELSLEKQSKQQAEQQVSELQLENASLKAQLVQKTVELNNTLAEVLQLLDKELEGDEYDGDEDEYMEGEEDGGYGEREDEEEDRLRFDPRGGGASSPSSAVGSAGVPYGSGANGVSARRFGSTGMGFQAAGRSPAMGSRGF